MSSKLDTHTSIIYRRGKRIGELDRQIPDLRLDVDMGSYAN